MRRFISLVGCLLATLIVAAGPAAAADGYNNLVQVDNSDSTHPAVSTASMVSHDTGTADVTNANLAYSHSFNCTGCRTVTAAVQAVIVEGSPNTIAPQNAAVAINENCSHCQTFAYAHQYLFLTHYRVTIDRKTSRQLLARVGYLADSVLDGLELAAGLGVDGDRVVGHENVRSPTSPRQGKSERCALRVGHLPRRRSRPRQAGQPPRRLPPRLRLPGRGPPCRPRPLIAASHGEDPRRPLPRHGEADHLVIRWHPVNLRDVILRGQDPDRTRILVDIHPR